MVASMNFIVDRCVRGVLEGALTHEHVIQSPAHVSFPCAPSVAPPRVLHFFRMGLSPGIHKPSLLKLGHAIDFILRIARSLVVVCFGPCQVQRRMRHVQVAAADHRLVLVQFIQVGQKSRVPLFPKGQPLQA